MTTRAGTRIPGVLWRIPGGSGEMLIVDPKVVRVLSGSEAAVAIQWAARIGTDQEHCRALLEMHASLDGGRLSPLGPQGLPDLVTAISCVADALARGDLVALEVPSTAPISQAEIDMLETLRRNRSRSIPAPAPQNRPPPPDIPLHKYAIRVMDDTGAPVAGVKLKLEIDGTPKMPITGADGLAVAEWFSTSPASVRILEQSTLEEQLKPRLTQRRSQALPSGQTVFELALGSPFRDLRAPADEETTLILARPNTWMEIVLKNQHDEPLSGCQVAIVRAKTNTHELHTTDEEGRVWLDLVDPDDISVSFPEFDDERDWHSEEPYPGQEEGP